MSALESLLRLYRLQFWLIIVVIVLVVAAVGIGVIVGVLHAVR